MGGGRKGWLIPVVTIASVVVTQLGAIAINAATSVDSRWPAGLDAVRDHPFRWAGGSTGALILLGVSAWWLERRLAGRSAGLNGKAGRAASGPTPARAAGQYLDTYDPVIQAFEERHLASLRDRDQDLADLAARVVSMPGYLLVEAPMYAGKTALLTALRRELQRRQCAVVVFFIRRGSDDTAEEFLPKVISQLLQLVEPFDPVLTGEGVARTFDEQRLQLADLWRRALGLIPAPLVLIVDGLDEQRHAWDSGQPGVPISRLLPADYATTGRVVVSSRPNPDPAMLVPAEHPFGQLAAERRLALAPSPHALAHREKVERELDRYLVSGANAESMAGLYALAGATLSDDEVGDALDLTPGQTRRLREPIAASLLRVVDGQGIAGFQFGHDALRAYVLERMGVRGRQLLVARVLAWADRYADEGWPTGTPTFLRDRLHTFLIDNDVPDRPARLVALVNDARRDLTITASHNVTGFLHVITAAQRELAGQPATPASAADTLWLLCQQLEAGTSMGEVPISALRALTLVGEAAEAQAVAVAQGNPPRRVRALSAVALARLESGEPAVAAAIAEEAAAHLPAVRSEWDQAVLHAEVAVTFAELGEQARAQALSAAARRILHEALMDLAGQGQVIYDAVDPEPERRAVAVRVAEAQALAGAFDATDDELQFGSAAADLDDAIRTAAALAGIGRIDEATRLAAEAPASLVSVRVLSRAAVVAGAPGLAREAYEAAGNIADPVERGRAETHSAAALARLGDTTTATECAERYLTDLDTAARDTETVAELALLLARVDRRNDARDLARRAIRTSHRPRCLIRSTDGQPHHVRQYLVDLARALAEANMAAEARDTARAIFDGHRHSIDGFVSVVIAHAAVGASEDARSALTELHGVIAAIDRQLTVDDLAQLAAAHAACGEPAERERLARQASALAIAEAAANPSFATSHLIRHARTMAEHGHAAQALDLAGPVREAIGDRRGGDGPYIGRLAVALARAGQAGAAAAMLKELRAAYPSGTIGHLGALAAAQSALVDSLGGRAGAAQQAASSALAGADVLGPLHRRDVVDLAVEALVRAGDTGSAWAVAAKEQILDYKVETLLLVARTSYDCQRSDWIGALVEALHHIPAIGLISRQCHYFLEAIWVATRTPVMTDAIVRRIKQRC